MKLLADENMPSSLVAELRAADFDVEHVYEIARGATDLEIIAHAVRERAVILTADKDFGELVIGSGLRVPGVVLVRLHPVGHHVEAIVAAVSRHAEKLQGAFSVLEEGRIRVRRLP